jgi:ergothioneine biosynthesis protein EgtB
LVSRPSAAEVGEYRAHVDRAMQEFLASDALDDDLAALIELGLHHEQQHQELLLMDIKHVLSVNPLLPAYRDDLVVRAPQPNPSLTWVEHEGGLVEVGHDADAHGTAAGFAFDNESPRHAQYLRPFALAERPVTCGDWLAFVADGGYTRPELWLSDGWATVQAQGWRAPAYWSTLDDTARVFTLAGPKPVDAAEPVCHISYYEADAYARWAGARLPSEAEWEVVAAAEPVCGRMLDETVLHPVAVGPAGSSLYGDVWQWTSSAYLPYPGFAPAPGAVGE